MPARTGSSVVVEDLLFRYPENDFQLAISKLELGAGQKLACIGPSGSGKTTFLHLLAGILLAQPGSVRIDGEDWAAHDEAARRSRRLEQIGLVFQEFELLEHLSLRENILLPSWLAGTQRIPSETELCGLARDLGLEQRLNAHPRRLSQGERQRAAICRALIHRPRLLLADEPTGNLDPAATRRVLELLLAEVDRRGVSLVLSTHDHGLLEAFDRVIDFGQGAPA